MLKEGAQSKNFFLILMGLVALLSIFIVFPFLTSIISGAILAYVFYPVYKKVNQYIGRKSISAFIVAVLIVLLVTVPMFFIVNTLTKETHYLYTRAKQQISSGRIIGERCLENTILCRGINDVNSLLENNTAREYIIGLLNKVLSFVTSKISSLIISLPKIILHLLITIFTTYYLLKDGKELIHRAAKIAPLKVHHQEQIITQIGDITYAVIYGSFIVALAQGTLGAFGFWLFGIKSFIWWGVVMTFFAIIPFIGTWVVWIPASVFLAISGYLQGEPSLIWRGVGLFFFGLLFISTIDNILKPMIVAGRARVHPLLILIGILGGLFVFGLIGIIIGPLMLALLQTLLQIYEKERESHLDEPEPDILGRKNHHRTRS